MCHTELVIKWKITPKNTVSIFLKHICLVTNSLIFLSKHSNNIKYLALYFWLKKKKKLQLRISNTSQSADVIFFIYVYDVLFYYVSVTCIYFLVAYYTVHRQLKTFCFSDDGSSPPVY